MALESPVHASFRKVLCLAITRTIPPPTQKLEAPPPPPPSQRRPYISGVKIRETRGFLLDTMLFGIKITQSKKEGCPLLVASPQVRVLAALGSPEHPEHNSCDVCPMVGHANASTGHIPQQSHRPDNLHLRHPSDMANEARVQPPSHLGGGGGCIGKGEGIPPRASSLCPASVSLMASQRQWHW